MLIKLSPVSPLVYIGVPEVIKAGDVLTINGEDFDLSLIPAGATLPREAITSPYFAGPIERTAEGQLILTLVLPHGPGAPHECCFPVPIVDPADGPIILPAMEQPE